MDEIERRLSTPVTVEDHEYVITRLGDEAPVEPQEPAPMVPGPLFADLVLRETVVQTASLACGPAPRAGSRDAQPDPVRDEA